MRERDDEGVEPLAGAADVGEALAVVDLGDARGPLELEEARARAAVRLADTVNLLFANCANGLVPVAPTHFLRFHQRTFTVFGYSPSLLSRGRSFSR